MSTSSDDIVALGGNLEPETLREAYRNGVFPWPADDLPLLWFCPRERAILELARLHVGRSLARARRRSRFTFTIDAAFERVIAQCAREPRPGQDGTWITDEMIEAYVRLHRLGFAHSVEAWLDDRLVGGLYGVETDGAFSAESMFYHEPYASRLAILHLADHLAARGAEWVDIQVMTPHMERLGARNVTRREFLDLLRRTRARGLHLFDPPERA
jgi:leucyl/phenylalanyl-tRNA--protein transferase